MNNYELKITYQQIQEDGSDKRVSENYVVQAYSLYEAIANLSAEFSHFMEADIESGKKVKIDEIIYHDITNSELDYQFFNAKVYFISLDEKSGKEKKTKHTFLVRATSLNEARLLVEESMKTTLIDYTIGGVVDTNIVDIIKEKSNN